jgi:hypothetical protein
MTRRERFVSLASLIGAAVWVVACQYDPHAHQYTRSKPAASDVAGVYRLTSETLLNSDLSEFDRRVCVVRLNTDGTFEAVNVPSWNLDHPVGNLVERLLSSSGTWRIDSVGAVDNGWSSQRVWGVYLDSPTVKLPPAHLTGQKSPYGLIFSLGDPDAGEALILTRNE